MIKPEAVCKYCNCYIKEDTSVPNEVTGADSFWIDISYQDTCCNAVSNPGNGHGQWLHEPDCGCDDGLAKLLHCPSCDLHLADKATRCPHCGEEVIPI